MTGLTETEYFDVIRRKTAVLFETACRVSAVLADAPEERESALAAYGYNLGMAFQIADDLFDYTAATPELGKEIEAGRIPVREAIVAEQQLIDVMRAHVETRRALCLASVELALAAGVALESGPR